MTLEPISAPIATSALAATPVNPSPIATSPLAVRQRNNAFASCSTNLG